VGFRMHLKMTMQPPDAANADTIALAANDR
jgi:hypothetical protein